jgi:hypothetical protein
LNDCYRHAETQREYWTAGLVPIVVNHFKSRLLDIPLPLHIYYELRTNVCRWSQYHDKNGAYRRWRTYPAIYRAFMEVFSKAKAETLPPHQSMDYEIDLEPSYNLPYGQIYNFSELGGAIFTQMHGL